MRPFLIPLVSLFEQNANPAQAAPMKKYMRDQFEYLGIKSPQFKILMKEHIAAHGLPSADELDAIARELWELPYREFQYAATSLIGRMEKNLPKGFAPTFESLITHKSW